MVLQDDGTWRVPLSMTPVGVYVASFGTVHGSATVCRWECGYYFYPGTQIWDSTGQHPAPVVGDPDVFVFFSGWGAPPIRCDLEFSGGTEVVYLTWGE